MLPVRCQHPLVEAADALELVEDGREEIHVGIRLDLDQLADAGFDRFDPARIHEPHLAAAPLDRAQHLDRLGDRDEAHVRDAWVRAEDQEIVGVVEIRKRVHGARPEDVLARRELVAAVLRAGAVDLPRPEPLQERRRADGDERVEGGRVADVDGGRPVAVARLDRAERVRDARHRVVPPDALEPAARRAAERMREPVGVAVHVERRDPLVARPPARHRMLAIGTHGGERAAGDGRDEAARGLADAAEGSDVGHASGVARCVRGCLALDRWCLSWISRRDAMGNVGSRRPVRRWHLRSPGSRYPAPTARRCLSVLRTTRGAAPRSHRRTARLLRHLRMAQASGPDQRGAAGLVCPMR